MNRKQWLNIILVAFFIGGIGSIVMGRYLIPYFATFPGLSGLNKLVTSAPIIVNRREEVQLNEGINLMELTRNSGNVAVTIFSSEGTFLGNGIVVSSDGMLVTSEQVVKNLPQVQVIFNNGQTANALVRAADPKSDMVVLTAESSGLAIAQFEDAMKLEAGQRVFGLGRSNEEFVHKFTTGFITNPVRNSKHTETSRNTELFTEVLSTDMSFDPEFLGSPLFNLQGRVVGMITGNNQYVLAENMQTAISTFLAEGKITRPYVGLRYVFQPAGVLVQSVDRNSPAERAGLRPGDLITAIKGQDLANTSFEQIINHASENLTLKVTRGDSGVDLTLELIKR